MNNAAQFYTGSWTWLLIAFINLTISCIKSTRLMRAVAEHTECHLQERALPRSNRFLIRSDFWPLSYIWSRNLVLTLKITLVDLISSKCSCFRGIWTCDSSDASTFRSWMTLRSTVMLRSSLSASSLPSSSGGLALEPNCWASRLCILILFVTSTAFHPMDLFRPRNPMDIPCYTCNFDYSYLISLIYTQARNGLK